jgi:hypothetical protein
LPTSNYKINDQYGSFPLLADLKNENRAAFTRQSLGRIALNLLQQTYLLKLKGNDKAYSAIWSELMDNIIRQDFVQNEWSIANELVSHSNEKLSIDLLSDENLPKGIAESPGGKQIAFYFQQALEDNEKWSSYFWPSANGWHRLRTQENRRDAEWVFIQSKEAWPALKASTRLQANQEWLANYSPSLTRALQLRQNQQKPIALWIFYLLFLVSVGLLWLEEKF